MNLCQKYIVNVLELGRKEMVKNTDFGEERHLRHGHKGKPQQLQKDSDDEGRQLPSISTWQGWKDNTLVSTSGVAEEDEAPDTSGAADDKAHSQHSAVCHLPAQPAHKEEAQDDLHPAQAVHQTVAQLAKAEVALRQRSHHGLGDFKKDLHERCLIEESDELCREENNHLFSQQLCMCTGSSLDPISSTSSSSSCACFISTITTPPSELMGGTSQYRARTTNWSSTHNKHMKI
ncbi:hypothetical protein FQN60_016207 [Etheostoma spectabile]|uniref:Uncharacterized protein n=1 Tax=Etheostoma spectabile TaxID=54343 RepID=A0A5J5D459_9PERO|nr:hypothetical protein FQN60_016207 [Etheostoma spectabile]